MFPTYWGCNYPEEMFMEVYQRLLETGDVNGTLIDYRNSPKYPALAHSFLFSNGNSELKNKLANLVIEKSTPCNNLSHPVYLPVDNMPTENIISLLLSMSDMLDYYLKTGFIFTFTDLVCFRRSFVDNDSLIDFLIAIAKSCPGLFKTNQRSEHVFILEPDDGGATAVGCLKLGFSSYIVKNGRVSIGDLINGVDKFDDLSHYFMTDFYRYLPIQGNFEEGKSFYLKLPYYQYVHSIKRIQRFYRYRRCYLKRRASAALTIQEWFYRNMMTRKGDNIFKRNYLETLDKIRR